MLPSRALYWEQYMGAMQFPLAGVTPSYLAGPKRADLGFIGPDQNPCGRPMQSHWRIALLRSALTISTRKLSRLTERRQIRHGCGRVMGPSETDRRRCFPLRKEHQWVMVTDSAWGRLRALAVVPLTPFAYFPWEPSRRFNPGTLPLTGKTGHLDRSSRKGCPTG
jgi:hypothetical protein